MVGLVVMGFLAGILVIALGFFTKGPQDRLVEQAQNYSLVLEKLNSTQPDLPVSEHLSSVLQQAAYVGGLKELAVADPSIWVLHFDDPSTPLDESQLRIGVFAHNAQACLLVNAVSGGRPQEATMLPTSTLAVAPAPCQVD